MAKTLSEQVAELERERDAHKARADHNYREFVRLEAELNAAESALAQARVEGAREFARVLVDEESHHWDIPESVAIKVRRAIKDRFDAEYPATGEEPTRRSRRCPACERHVAVHAEDCPHRPAPPAVTAAPERGEDVARWQLARMAMLEIIDILDNCVGVDGLNATENDTWEEFRASGMLKAFDSLRIVMASEDSRADALASRPTASGEG